MKQLLIKCNVGSNERKVRLFVGLAAAVAAFRLTDRRFKWGLGALGLAEIAAAASRYSPINQLLGINRCQPAYRAFPHLLRRL